MVAFHRALSDRSVHLRYLAGFSYAQRTAHERLTRVCGIDYDREMALVAEVLDEGPKRGTIVGVGRLVRGTDDNQGEFALVVADEFQGRGLGAELLRRLVQIGRDEKLDGIEGWIALSNTAMQKVSRRLGFEVRMNPDEELVHATLPLI
jgi:acetyltransferase